MIFVDTSVLVPAAQSFHEDHARAARIVRAATPEETCTGAHAVTELYSVLTRTRKPHMLSPKMAVMIVEDFLRHLNVVGLTAAETIQVIEECSRRGVAGGIVYDAILVACARKAHAERIYTFNARHFRLVAPDLGHIIREP